ncbi:MAG: peptidoglycan DD-metalloendopeptidase family protein [Gammaproteobacteria bacterium]|nr:peptidoglycan DD-metalloendopeptidase family protein [Gammaproteobacteria bacterium]
MRTSSLWPLWLPLLTTTLVGAESDPAQNLGDVRNRINEIEKSLVHDESKFSSARERVLEIEQRLHAARLENEKLHLALEAKITRIASLRQERNRLHESYEGTAEAVKNTLRARYVLQRQPKLKVLFGSTGLNGLRRNLKYYDYISAANNELLRQQSVQLGQLDAVESALKLEASKLRQIRNQAENHMNALNDALAKRSRIVESLQKLLQHNEQALEQLREDENELTKLVDEVTEGLQALDSPPAPFRVLKGELAWPTAGRIAKAPGGAMREGGAKWSGVVIESNPGSTVAAIAAGRVTFADWFRNLGLLVIIDHGDDYMSLYGHNQELYKQNGDWVDAGEIVATVGDTGGQTTAGLYFEIRQGGTPQDPRQWCKR